MDKSIEIYLLIAEFRFIRIGNLIKYFFLSIHPSILKTLKIEASKFLVFLFSKHALNWSHSFIQLNYSKIFKMLQKISETYYVDGLFWTFGLQ